MGEILFENTVNAAAPDYPYLNFRVRDLCYTAHFHQEIELVAVLEGVVTVTCGAARFTAGQGKLCVFMPGEIHNILSAGKSLVSVVKINPKRSAERVDFLGLRLPNPVLAGESPLGACLWARLDTMAAEAEAKRPGYAYAIDSAANDCVCALLRSGLLRQVPPSVKKKQRSAATMLEQVERYIEAHYTQQISLGDMAAHCRYSPYYFAHFFKEVTHCTFFEYLTRYRLEQAQKLLLYSGEKMTHIAERAGFSNIRSFNREFKKVFGQPPSRYKKGNSAI